MAVSENEQSCECRIAAELRDRINDLRGLWDAYRSDGGEHDALAEYGLAFDYVAARTFTGQREGYFRYQLSWGGPSDEFRFFVDLDLSCHRVEYWFLDWFDGAHRALVGPDEGLLLELWDWFCETGAVELARRGVP